MTKAATFWKQSLTTALSVTVAAFWITAGTLVLPGSAGAAQCGPWDGQTCKGTARQFGGTFNPGAGFGGFGGGNCTAARTPVIFIHGIGDNALSWDAPPGDIAGHPTPPRSVYAEMKARGYNDCELFGLTWLSDNERSAVVGNSHRQEKYDLITRFIDAVKAYTGHTKVDIVAHSLGVTQTLAALKVNDRWSSIRKFINIAGGLRGFNSCFYTGPGDILAAACGAQSTWEANAFGLFPQGWYSGSWVANRWTGAGTANSLRDTPYHHPATRFYTIAAGTRDELACTTASFRAGCDQTARFSGSGNVRAQINVGAGKEAALVDFSWKDGVLKTLAGGDTSGGVGHFRAARNTGAIIQRMLLTECSGLECAADYRYGPKAPY